MTNKELKQKYGTVPFMILTETLAMGVEVNDINPFYGASREDVLNNYEYAKECYYKVRSRLTSSWSILQCYKEGIIKSTNSDYVIKNKDKILNAIKQHKIKPMPMIEFTI